MSVTVKICGLREIDALDAAIDAGADYIGLVFYPPSPRNVDLEEAVALADHARGRATIVALLVDPDDAQVSHVSRDVRPDMIQLHGSESPERVAEIKKLSGRPVIKAIKVATRGDVDGAAAYRGVADRLLFDARAPEGASGMLPGGNGIAFDWRTLAGVDPETNYLLSGGLDAENVAEAIRVTGAPIVDVSSGVEEAPGIKDTALIRRFIAAAKGPIETTLEKSGTA